MIHAADYSNMGLDQVDRTIMESRKKDRILAKGIQ